MKYFIIGDEDALIGFGLVDSIGCVLHKLLYGFLGVATNVS